MHYIVEIHIKKGCFLLSKKEKNKICPICDSKLGFLKHEFKGSIRICNSCYSESGIKLKELVERGQKKISISEIKERIKLSIESKEKEAEEVENFVATKKIGNFVAFDDDKKQWAQISTFMGKVKRVYNYRDIVNFELLEDGDSVASGGLGRALAGGVLFGGAGAIVGGVTGKKKSKGICNSLKLKVTIDDMNTPVVYIKFIETKTKKKGFTYKSIAESAQECLSTFQLICDNKNESNENDEVNRIRVSPADEIIKYKELLSAGAITEEEYEIKKEELLGL